MTTNEAAGLFKDESLDAVFIDADHSYEAVKMDIQNWMPKVRRGGILAGHDYNSAWPGVIRAVNEILPEAEKIDYCWVKKC
jgi:predicted O-methyltransferase YrrM